MVIALEDDKNSKCHSRYSLNSVGYNFIVLSQDFYGPDYLTKSDWSKTKNGQLQSAPDSGM